MDKIAEIFSQEELDYLSKERPDLVPMDIPSMSDAKTLSKPSLDQIIVQFLEQYEVNVEPRSVGAWNGWDTVSTVSSILSSERGSMSNIASTMFYANRSNQINSAAQDWGTWKRWVFDKKEREFEQFKNEVIESINIHNKNIIAQTEAQIREAVSNNQKIFKVLDEPAAKKTIAELREVAKENVGKISFECAIYGSILFLLILIISLLDGPPLLIGFMAIIEMIMNLFGIGIGIKFLFSNSQKKFLGITGITISAALFIIMISLAN